MSEWRKVFCRHCRQVYLTGYQEQCDLCGKSGGLTDPLSPEAMQAQEAREAEMAPPPGGVPRAEVSAWDAYSLLKTVGAGLLFMGGGLWLLLDPRLRANPEAPPTIGLVVFCLVLVLVGGACLLLAFLTVLRWIRDS